MKFAVSFNGFALNVWITALASDDMNSFFWLLQYTPT